MKESLRQIGARLLRRVADERGIALVFAMLVTTALGIVTMTVVYFASASSNVSARASDDQQAYALAEAGINTAIAKIYGAPDSRLMTLPVTAVPKCPGSNPVENPSCYNTGSVTYSGTLDKTGLTWYWAITSVGSVPASGGLAAVRRKLTRSVGITGNNGTNGSSWTRFYQDSASKCLTLDGISVPTNFASRGCINLINGANVTGDHTNINAGGNIYLDPPRSPSDDNNGWNAAGNGWVPDALYADSGNLTNGATSANYDLYSFGCGTSPKTCFDLPTGTTVNGIVVSIQRKASANTTSNYIRDTDIYLLKAGTASGTDHAVTGTKWPTADGTQVYGTPTDLWGTSWTPANINSSTFGVRIKVNSTCTGSCSVKAYVNAVTMTVYYTPSAAIGTSGTPIAEADVGGGCQLNGGTLDTPCSSADKVNATLVKTVAPADNPAITMPVVDWNYWWANAKPGPKHFCTNPSPGNISTSFFDNNASTTNGPDRSLNVNGEMAPPGRPYDCEVWENGVLQGKLVWDGAHRLDIYGTIFVDGNFRFDTDGEIIHYFGRATIMSSRDDEIDSLVCAGGDTVYNDYQHSCSANMATWSPNQNMMVLMSQENNEYDQGGTGCAGGGNTPPTCYHGFLPAGFQGIMYSTADCLIHQNFMDSGPVICNTITLPNEGNIDPTFYTFPSVGNLTNGMSYSNTATATEVTINVSAQGDG